MIITCIDGSNGSNSERTSWNKALTRNGINVYLLYNAYEVIVRFRMKYHSRSGFLLLYLTSNMLETAVVFLCLICNLLLWTTNDAKHTLKVHLIEPSLSWAEQKITLSFLFGCSIKNKAYGSFLKQWPVHVLKTTHIENQHLIKLEKNKCDHFL